MDRQSNNGEQWLPKKKIKRQNEDNNQNEPKQQAQIFCKCYDEKQINLLLSALLGLQGYSKYISIVIRHTEKSIQALPLILRNMPQFKQLDERVSKCIERARVNNQLLNNIANNYSSFLSESIKAQGFRDTNEQITPNLIINIFIAITKEWGNLSRQVRLPMLKTVQLMQQYYNCSQNQGKRPTVFVQGSGMGRLIYQIGTTLTPCPQSIEACESRVLHYLCGQYFIQKYKNGKFHEQNIIYPFIHDFTNKYNAEDAYQAISIPQIQNTLGKHINEEFSQSEISVNLGNLEQQYAKSGYNNQWDILVSYACTDKIKNVLKWIQIVYKGLKQNGIWVITFYSSFQNHEVPLTYAQFMQILRKTQFKLLCDEKSQQQIISERGMTKQILIMHYIVLQK